MIAALLLCLLGGAQDDATEQVDIIVEKEDWTLPADLRLRVRVVSITPAEPTTIQWRHGGEGLGGNVSRGDFGKDLPVGTWSDPVPVTAFGGRTFPRVRFLTLTAGRAGRSERISKEDPDRRRKVGFSTDVELEFELLQGDRSLKRWSARGPRGGTIGLVIPAERLAGGKGPDDAHFLEGFTDLRAYARARTETLEGLRWAKGPRPERFSILTTLGGFGEGSGYGVRHTDTDITRLECRSLRVLGVNGFVNAPDFAVESVREKGGFEGGFGRAIYRQLGGYPVPSFRKGRKNEPDAGCPSSPAVAERMREMIRTGLEEARSFAVDEVWWRTVDEIGAVVDRSAEGKAHLSKCDRCAEGFQTYLKGLGVTAADVGADRWEDVRPLDLWSKRDGTPPWRNDPADALRAYHTARFNNHVSAKLFTPLREALAEANRTRTSGPAVYSFALRGNTFLMRGHSLDFFNYYRHADNAFVYETSNRDARIWGWDGYLCDVGRVVSADQGLRFGVYVKPHRGAPVQRALAAASRGATMIYWYTYGPDYAKGDSFSSRPDRLEETAKAAWLLGQAEDVLYGAVPLVPAQVAVVKPRTSEIWRRLDGRSANDWENAKWIYTALTHAHLPVDPVDEEMVATADLSRYRVIYVNGPNITRAAAAKLAGWVRAGGTLVTSGGGLARNEANQPLAELQSVLGLKRRGKVEEKLTFKGYGASGLQAFRETVDVGIDVSGKAPFDASFRPTVGREELWPAEGAESPASFSDRRRAAVVRHRAGKGTTTVIGLFPGLEYSMKVRRDVFDMSRDFDAGIRRWTTGPALEVVSPPATVSHPLVEIRLVRNPETGKRAAVLMNWAYKVTGKRIRGKRASTVKALVPMKDLEVRIRGIDGIGAVRSAVLDRVLDVERGEDSVRVVLPLLEEGDVLRLE